MEGAPFVSTSTSSSPSSYSLLSEVARVLDAGPHTGPLLVQQLRKRHLSVEDVLAAADAAEVGADEAGDKRRRQSGGWNIILSCTISRVYYNYKHFVIACRPHDGSAVELRGLPAAPAVSILICIVMFARYHLSSISSS